MKIEILTLDQETIDKIDIDLFGSLENAKIQKAKEDKLWCKCEEDHGANYVPDGQSSICHKHHWTCIKCHKIVQVG